MREGIIKKYAGNYFYQKRFHSFGPQIMDALTKILTVAVESFRQYGFKTITMDDIARRAGISKKTLYQHFTSKPDVVQAAMTWHQEAMHCHMVELIAGSENAVEGMVRVNGLLNQMFRQINPLAMLELQRFFPEVYRMFREKLIHKDISAIRDNILRGMEEGLYREGMDADLLARYRIECCLILFQPDSLLGEVQHPHLVNKAIMENFLYGLMTQKGEKLYQKYSEKYLKEVPRI
jgi:AcrR family transcriptional regulator